MHIPQDFLNCLCDSPVWQEYLRRSEHQGWENILIHDYVRKSWDELQNLQKVELENKNLLTEVACQVKGMQTKEIEQLFLRHHPWRKGPYTINGIKIDSEWQSFLKWNRIAPHIKYMQGAKVLDVGCASGYYAYRLKAIGAKAVLGLEPFPKSILQFYFLQHFFQESHIHVLPLRLEDFPVCPVFDYVFSMGILYHVKSPIDHLTQIAANLRPKGTMVLESLIVDEHYGPVLCPEDRYCAMPNVWFIPSVSQAELWMRRCGFDQIRILDITTTTTEEQRKTPWMSFQSLEDFLNPADVSLSIEGYPAPKRALWMAQKKG